MRDPGVIKVAATMLSALALGLGLQRVTRRVVMEDPDHPGYFLTRADLSDLPAIPNTADELLAAIDKSKAKTK